MIKGALFTMVLQRDNPKHVLCTVGLRKLTDIKIAIRQRIYIYIYIRTCTYLFYTVNFYKTCNFKAGQDAGDRNLF